MERHPGSSGDGEHVGVAVMFYDFDALMTLTNDEAIDLATEILNATPEGD